MDLELLQACFTYDPATGVLRWKIRPSRRVKAGDIAGSLREKDGYLLTMFRKQGYYVHRVCYALGAGKLPEFEVDHRDGARTNNRFDNLRDATPSINQQNRRRVTKRNLVGVQGVSQVPSGRFRAVLTNAGKTVYGGTYDTAEEAHQAHVNLKRKLHPGNTL